MDTSGLKFRRGHPRLDRWSFAFKKTGVIALLAGLVLFGLLQVVGGLVGIWLRRSWGEAALESSAVVVAIGFAWATSKRRRRPESHLPPSGPPANTCGHCGYSLAGLGWAACPECGRYPALPH
jgi:hypothetical protein